MLLRLPPFTSVMANNWPIFSIVRSYYSLSLSPHRTVNLCDVALGKPEGKGSHDFGQTDSNICSQQFHCRSQWDKASELPEEDQVVDMTSALLWRFPANNTPPSRAA
jgi:hypothetical protein